MLRSDAVANDLGAVHLAPAVCEGPESLKTERHERRERETPQQARARWTRKIVAVLKASREDADVTRIELAEWLGFTVNQVANLEYGRRELRVVDLIMIAQALRLDPEALLRRILRW